MKKLSIILLLIFTLLFSAIPVSAANEALMFTDTITVTADGGRYQIGFVNIEFKKEFLDPELLPVTFEVKVFANNGAGTIEFLPDTLSFFKKVHIRVGSYEGLLYDIAAGENIQVEYKNKQILAKHFSRYSW